MVRQAKERYLGAAIVAAGFFIPVLYFLDQSVANSDAGVNLPATQRSRLQVSSVTLNRSPQQPPSGPDSRDSSSLAKGISEVTSHDPAASSGNDSQSQSLEAAENDQLEPVLSDRVMRVIQEVQTRQLAEQWEEALNEMNALYTEFDDLNSFEQSTLLNFYTNTLVRMQMWEEAVSALTLMLTIDDLRPSHHARALLAIGQLQNRLGAIDDAISHYDAWLDFTEGLDEFSEQRERVLEQLSQIGNEAI